jgi:hypothetical protein
MPSACATASADLTESSYPASPVAALACPALINTYNDNVQIKMLRSTTAYNGYNEPQLQHHNAHVNDREHYGVDCFLLSANSTDDKRLQIANCNDVT